MMNKTASLLALLILWIAPLAVHPSQPNIIPVTRSLAGVGLETSLPVVPWENDFEQFRSSVTNGNAGQVTGIYAPMAFSFPIIQQPAGQQDFVNTDPGVITQFSAAASFGTIGLLAHDNLAGANFYQLKYGETFYILYGDGHAVPYWIDQIRTFQALTPGSPFSQFIDQANPGVRLSSAQVFGQIYTHPDQVVLQTCLERNGDQGWGRIFLIATPRSLDSMRNIPAYRAGILK